MVGRPTDVPERIMAYLRAWDEPDGPTVREIRAALELSSISVVGYHLAALERAGRIRRYTQRPTRIEVVE